MQNSTKSLSNRLWAKLLVGGIGLFSATLAASFITGNPNFFPTLLLVGAFTVPIAFVVFIYEHEVAEEVPMTCLTTCFLAGGFIGVIAAGIIEFETLQGSGIIALLLVGLIEESSKLILPTYQYFRRQYHFEADGLLFGVAAGMGFAALETMGYGMTAAIDSGGDIASVSQILLIRGLLSPAGHAAWTGIVTSVMWRERERHGRGILSPTVLLAFAEAILLHFLWDFVNSLAGTTVIGFIIATVGLLVVAGLSLFLLGRRIREAKRVRESVLP